MQVTPRWYNGRRNIWFLVKIVRVVSSIVKAPLWNLLKSRMRYLVRLSVQKSTFPSSLLTPSPNICLAAPSFKLGHNSYTDDSNFIVLGRRGMPWEVIVFAHFVMPNYYLHS
jgi:hypothetical protein